MCGEAVVVTRGNTPETFTAPDKLRGALLAKGWDIAFVSQTTQIFITVTHSRAQELQQQVKLGFMEAVDADHVMLRICTSWATTDGQVAALIALL